MVKYLNFIGLCCNIVGALFIFGGVYKNKKKALRNGVPIVASINDEKNLQLSLVASLLKQSKWTLWGTFFLLVGFIFQAIASWPFGG